MTHLFSALIYKDLWQMVAGGKVEFLFLKRLPSRSVVKYLQSLGDVRLPLAFKICKTQENRVPDTGKRKAGIAFGGTTFLFWAAIAG